MKQHRPTRKRQVLNPAAVRKLCHEVLPIGAGALPVKAVGWTDLHGRWTRMQATYPNGWVLSFSFGDGGSVTNVSSRLSMVFGKPEPRHDNA